MTTDKSICHQFPSVAHVNAILVAPSQWVSPVHSIGTVAITLLIDHLVLMSTYRNSDSLFQNIVGC